MRIYKYTFSGIENAEFEMPKGAEILCVQIQSHLAVTAICIWALVDSLEARVERRRFMVIGTGHELYGVRNVKYVGTVQEPPFVWHIFEVLP